MVTVLVILLIIGLIIGLISLITCLICCIKYEKFEKPRSFESDYPSLRDNRNTFIVMRVIDKNHVIAQRKYEDVYIIVTGKFCEMAIIKYKNPVIIGRCHYNNKYYPIVEEGDLKQLQLEKD